MAARIPSWGWNRGGPLPALRRMRDGGWVPPSSSVLSWRQRPTRRVTAMTGHELWCVNRGRPTLRRGRPERRMDGGVQPRDVHERRGGPVCAACDMMARIMLDDDGCRR